MVVLKLPQTVREIGTYIDNLEFVDTPYKNGQVRGAFTNYFESKSQVVQIADVNNEKISL